MVKSEYNCINISKSFYRCCSFFFIEESNFSKHFTIVEFCDYFITHFYFYFSRFYDIAFSIRIHSFYQNNSPCIKMSFFRIFYDFFHSFFINSAEYIEVKYICHNLVFNN